MENTTNSGYKSPSTSNTGGNSSGGFLGVMQQKLPGDPLALTLGIIALVLFVIGCFCYALPAIITLVLSIIGLVSANKSIKLYAADPEKYYQGSYQSVKNGRIINIIAVILSGLGVLIFIIIAIFFSALLTSELGDQFKEGFNDGWNDSMNDDGYYEDDAGNMDETDTYETTEDDWKYEEDVDTLELEEAPDPSN